jgi:ABC-2 type transport system ATP-binding protein
MRLILGLDGPTSGEDTVGGKLYRDLPAPLREVGALIDAKAVHPSRTAYDYLLALAQSNAIPAARVDEVLGLVGLEGVAGKRIGGFSLGMGQRLGIAGALLGDPPVLMFDEPLNGLDPEGIVWIRQLMRHLAGDGRTVFVSSHLMNEMAVTADHLIVIGQGKLLRDEGMTEFIESSSQRWVLVRSPQLKELSTQLEAVGATVKSGPEDSIEVAGIDSRGIGALAARQRTDPPRVGHPTSLIGGRVHGAVPRQCRVPSKCGSGMTTNMAMAGPGLVTPRYRAAGFSDVLRAEWTKPRTVPSTMWSLIVAAVLGIGLGASSGP